MIHKVSTVIGGRELSIEVGRMAKQANGSALIRYGDTVVLATACASAQTREEIDFFPLTVDYREYTYAAGKIPGGFFKREGKPTEREVLTSRLIDRPLRPMFQEGYRQETQVIAMVLSVDGENSPDILGLTAASTALMISDIPFHIPMGCVRVGLVGDRYLINPSLNELKESRLNLVVTGSLDAIVMVEAGAQEVTEGEVLQALEEGHKAIRELIALQQQLVTLAGKPKREVLAAAGDEELKSQVEAEYAATIREALHTPGKLASYGRLDALKEALKKSIPESEPAKRRQAARCFESLLERIFREEVLVDRKRCDERRFDEIRPITIETSVLPRTHGSALFTRGETQALVTITLGTADDEQRLDSLEGESKKRFMLHYNFPPFSVGEVGMLRGPGRREVGHGALAERALLGIMPKEEAFPYTVRIVSDTLESNGSSSMATVCGGCLALMDAGVKVSAPVAGVAMGLVKEGEKYAILTDIAGAEDHYGDMDFKVAGTRNGITALQMDIKVQGLTAEILREALEQAKQGRLFILDRMAEALSEPREELSIYAPRIFTMRIPTEKIGGVIGTGGKTIRSIIDRTGVKIDIQDDGQVNIAATDADSAQKAIRMIEDLTATAELNKTYLGKVVRITDFGAFVEIFPGTEGLLHISEIAEQRVEDVRDELKEGDQILVKVISIDPTGKVKLSRKAVIKEQRGEEYQPPAPRPDRGGGRFRSGDGGRREHGSSGGRPERRGPGGDRHSRH
jgi:polyribonucleotide nucleotidyltransferase